MKPARTLVAAVLVASPLAFAAVACTPPQPYANCGNIDQIPNSDAGEWNIQAHKADCPTARSVVHQVAFHNHGQPYSYLGWNCTGGIPSGGLGSYYWCNGPGGAVITWRG
jgi:hypothetical protein